MSKFNMFVLIMVIWPYCAFGMNKGPQDTSYIGKWLGDLYMNQDPVAAIKEKMEIEWKIMGKRDILARKSTELEVVGLTLLEAARKDVAHNGSDLRALGVIAFITKNSVDYLKLSLTALKKKLASLSSRFTKLQGAT